MAGVTAFERHGAILDEELRNLAQTHPAASAPPMLRRRWARQGDAAFRMPTAFLNCGEPGVGGPPPDQPLDFQEEEIQDQGHGAVGIQIGGGEPYWIGGRGQGPAWAVTAAIYLDDMSDVQD